MPRTRALRDSSNSGTLTNFVNVVIASRATLSSYFSAREHVICESQMKQLAPEIVPSRSLVTVNVPALAHGT
jgi:hypothetical protein